MPLNPFLRLLGAPAITADDLVVYNSIQMWREYAESLDDSQHLAYYAVDGNAMPRIPFGDETYPMMTIGDSLCPCCSAARSQLHEPLCEREQCPVCKQQVMSCDCDFFVENAVKA